MNWSNVQTCHCVVLLDWFQPTMSVVVFSVMLYLSLVLLCRETVRSRDKLVLLSSKRLLVGSPRTSKGTTHKCELCPPPESKYLQEQLELVLKNSYLLRKVQSDHFTFGDHQASVWDDGTTHGQESLFPRPEQVNLSHHLCLELQKTEQLNWAKENV